jgi:hypothetical protein
LRRSDSSCCAKILAAIRRATHGKRKSRTSQQSRSSRMFPRTIIQWPSMILASAPIPTMHRERHVPIRRVLRDSGTGNGRKGHARWFARVRGAGRGCAATSRTAAIALSTTPAFYDGQGRKGSVFPRPNDPRPRGLEIASNDTPHAFCLIQAPAHIISLFQLVSCAASCPTIGTIGTGVRSRPLGVVKLIAQT